MRLQTMAASAAFSALIFISITTMAIPNGFGGVIHFGDTLIYVAAATLPFPYGLFVAAIGSGLFNLVRVPVWLPFTIVIKPIMALFFTSKCNTILGAKRNIIAPLFAGIINVVLYFSANMLLFGGWNAGIAALPGLIIQSGGSLVFFFVIAAILDKLQFKQRIIK